MKKYLFALACAALAGSAWAQNPVGVITGPQATNQVVPTGATATATAIMGSNAQVGTAHPGHCAYGTCPKTKTACVPEPTTEKKTKVLFSSQCATVCAKGCNLFKKGGNCDSCKDGTCGCSHVEHYLYKRVQTQECNSFKCVPSQVPACAPKCTSVCAGGSCCGSAAATSGQPASMTPPTGASSAPTAETIIIVPSPGASSTATNPVGARLP